MRAHELAPSDSARHSQRALTRPRQMHGRKNSARFRVCDANFPSANSNCVTLARGVEPRVAEADDARQTRADYWPACACAELCKA